MRSKIIKTILLTIIVFLPFVPFANASQVLHTVATITILPADELISHNIKAIPEKRVYKSGGNNVANFRITFTNPTNGNVLKQNTFATNSGGTYTGLSMSELTPGTYHIYGKTDAHLTDKEASVTLNNSNILIDFSNGDTDILLAGDINGAEFGDDVVNAIDLSILISDIDTSDLRSDLNQDTTVNAMDLSALIANIDAVGDV